MSEGPEQSNETPPAPAPTVVVGYPDASLQPVAGVTPGLASLRSQIRTLRYLLVVCLVLLVVMLLSLAIALGSNRAQIDDLSAQVTALGARAEAPAAAPPVTPAQPTAQPTPEATGVAQLGPAPELDATTTVPAGADPTGAILIGNPDASDVVEVYIDYQCPFCQRWEATVGRALVDKAMQPGSDLLIKQYNLAFLGEKSADLTPAGASARAASAAACVVNHDGIDTFVTFSRSLFEAADPSEPPGQFTAPVLTDLAQQAGASADSVACIKAEENVPFVSATTKAGFSRGVGGTPTVVVNGTTIGNAFTDPMVIDLAGAGATAN